MIDFGLSAFLPALESTRFTDHVGTPLFMSPKEVEQSPKGYLVIPSELWSAGMVFWSLLSGKHPFRKVRSCDELRRLIGSGVQQLCTKYSSASQRLLSLLLVADETQSSTVAKAVSEVSKEKERLRIRCKLLPAEKIRDRTARNLTQDSRSHQH